MLSSSLVFCYATVEGAGGKHLATFVPVKILHVGEHITVIAIKNVEGKHTCFCSFNKAPIGGAHCTLQVY